MDTSYTASETSWCIYPDRRAGYLGCCLGCGDKRWRLISTRCYGRLLSGMQVTSYFVRVLNLKWVKVLVPEETLVLCLFLSYKKGYKLLYILTTVIFLLISMLNLFSIFTLGQRFGWPGFLGKPLLSPLLRWSVEFCLSGYCMGAYFHRCAIQ